jgi:hypothetical protein
MTWMMLRSWMKRAHECNKSHGWNYVNMPITKTFPPFLLPFSPSPPIFPVSQPQISSLLLANRIFLFLKVALDDAPLKI